MIQFHALSSIKRQLKTLTSAVWIALISTMFVLPVFAATPENTVNASATLAYNLKGLKHNVAVQKAYIASKYIYVTQRSKGTCYLSRLLMDGKNATYVDKMTITNAGHCQSLDMYSYNGSNYFYFSSKADSSTKYYWSLQVARLKYSPGATYNYTDLHRFTYMNYANETGTRLGKTYRVAGGGNSNYTIFRIQTEEGTVTWSIYDTAALNKLLDNNKMVRMDSAAAKNASITSFTQSGSNIVRPNGSFQGVDMLGNTEIFTSGGAEGQTPKLVRMSNTGAYKTLVNITNVGSREIEGVQTKNRNVYFTIVTDPVNKKNTQKIYYIPDSIGGSASNAYTPTGVCGSGFGVIDSHGLSGGKVYLLWNESSGENCVVTIKTSNVGSPSPMSASLQIEGDTQATNSGNFSYYAGPVTRYASNRCVKWGGSVGSSFWESSFGHCGS